MKNTTATNTELVLTPWPTESAWTGGVIVIDATKEGPEWIIDDDEDEQQAEEWRE